MSLLVLSASDVSQVTARFSPDELVAVMADVFSRLSTNDPGIIQPHRTSVPTGNHTCLFMPSRVASSGTTMKVVAVPTATAPQDVKERGLPGSTIVLDERNGGVKAIVNARSLTALRNAAGSLLSTRLLLASEAGPRSIVAFGAGAQVQAHLSLFLTAYPSIRLCTIFNRSLGTRVESLLGLMKTTFPAVQVAAETPSHNDKANTVNLKEEVGKADIIITATSSTEPLFPSEYVRSGTHLCLIGSYKPEMHEIDTALVKRAGMIVVDQKAACLQEAGELITAGFSETDLVELGQLYDFSTERMSWTPRTKSIQDIHDRGDVTIFKSVGVGVQDVVIACAVVQRATEEGIGRVIADYDV
ncbi:NAD(P)-binding protein [Dichomitus squalens LYAD-421 SS1]|uniref:NAD(P)-binding protein n=1 Tax=Dichomitus squalens (strain LYAD-421) TaxID=732165 RepID=R7T2U9_DICSQ|nr:NAD(P)-binding protein [Dichomitus squalens LYAD-421 SS1]EJF62087.1 NAD(P)-binding protein [Dichomitus squalens LYAD-421 SS1]